MPEGRDVGKPMLLREWQKAELRRIYDNPAGTRRAILSFGRKNGKTTFVALILLLHLCGPMSEPNSQMVSAAQSRDQAAILFALAAKIVRMSPDLSAAVNVRDTNKQLYCTPRGTSYRALSAEASTAYGLSPILSIHDELGQVKGPRSELYAALETAMGAHENPLSIIISTQAPTDSDLLSVLIDDALSGSDKRTVVSLHSAPEGLDPFGEEAIRAANPAFGDFLNSTEVLALAEEARRMPASEAQYRNLVLNQRVEASSPFVTRSVWQACASPPRSIEGRKVYGGLDLSEVRDLTALVLVGLVDGVWQVHPTFWLPQEGLADKARADRVPYDLWARDGQLKTVPGRSVEYEYVAQHLKWVFDNHDVVKLAFDRWNFRHLRPWLVRAGFHEQVLTEKFVEFGQGFQSMSPALRDLEAVLLNGKLAHGGHPIMNMCAESAVVQRDPAGNRKLNKAKSSNRIDGMVALSMAMGVASGASEERAPEYQMLVL